MSAAMKKARLPETLHNRTRNLTSGRKAGRRILQEDLQDSRAWNRHQFWGVAKTERHLIVNQAMRGFDSLRPSQYFFVV